MFFYRKNDLPLKTMNEKPEKIISFSISPFVCKNVMQATFKVLKFIPDVSTGILTLTQSGGYADMVPKGGRMVHQKGWKVISLSQSATLYTKNKNPEGIKHS